MRDIFFLRIFYCGMKVCYFFLVGLVKERLRVRKINRLIIIRGNYFIFVYKLIMWFCLFYIFLIYFGKVFGGLCVL